MDFAAELIDHEPGVPAGSLGLSNADKAAVIVRLLLSENMTPNLSGLSLNQQERLARRMGALGAIDRPTLAAVAREFAERVDNLGLTFPASMANALEMLGDSLPETSREQLRDIAVIEGTNDPWERLQNVDLERLIPILARESAEICAIMLAKLPVAKAASLLGELPEDRAQIVSHAVALTAQIDPETIKRVGASLMAELDADPAKAFADPAAERMGAILNATGANTREKVLEGLEARDAEFAGFVKKAIFTFEHIPKRVEPRDVPAIMRSVDNVTLMKALGAGMETAPFAVEFLLENMSKRLAEQLRDDAEECRSLPAAEGEAAMSEVILIIRTLVERDEIRLIPQED